ncbi:MAG: hypothetical protein A2289_01925 [Deltaproteobacteria bacterium RIFOXYA12_FULL_58_15]|nr:MAG: hypothetical protein A2289_01925 [Deltaproteobacteria bacterium RIFOXYA12_FULL_58_15]OGR14615.1 MAG: hypothetical protein A2341_07590 [Deltaproteobacteria bacterium RIFOXYB12_FULL_58_9]
MSRPDVAKSAAWYARRGWFVLPVHFPTGEGCSCGNPACERSGKHPATHDGCNGATPDAVKIAGWWRGERQWNVGLGTTGTFWVLDVDGAAGKASMAEAERRHGQLPVTVTSRTGNDGLHLFWRMPAKVPVRCRVAVLVGVDVRGAGGFVIAPPSMHVSGERYVWVHGRGPHEIAIAEAPPWLVALVNGSRMPTAHTNWGEVFRAQVPHGERNHAVAKRAGYLLALGVDHGAATELLIGWSRDHLRPPLLVGEIRRTVMSIDRRERRKAGGK